MSYQRLWIPGRFPGFNELVEAGATLGQPVGPSGKRFHGYRALKRQWQDRVTFLAQAARLTPPGPSYYTYVLAEPNRRRDPSNVAAAVIKIVEDALQGAKIIPNDGWSDILGFAAYWDVDKRCPGATVFVSEGDVLGREEALTLARESRS